jgi:hypothetical protein
MSHNTLMIGWNRAIPGREKQTLEHFQEFLGYLGKNQQQGNITSFTPVVLEAHGGDLNGFVLVQGETAGLRKMFDDEVYQDHVARAQAHMQGFGVVRGFTGKSMEKRLMNFAKYI